MSYSFTDFDGNKQYASATGTGTLSDPHIIKTEVTNLVVEELPEILNICNTISTSGDTQIITAPGTGKKIVIHYIQLQLLVSTETTISLKNGSTIFRRVLCTNKSDALVNHFFGDSKFTLNENQALNINLSVTSSVNVTIDYSIKDV